MPTSPTGTSTQELRRSRAVAVVALALAGLFAASPCAAWSASSVARAGESGHSVAQVDSYWTPKRMANATPLGVLKVAEPQDSESGGSTITPAFQSTQVN